MQDKVQFQDYLMVMCIGEKENPFTSWNMTGSKNKETSCIKTKKSSFIIQYFYNLVVEFRIT